jgi:hypothetical protein
VTRLSDDRTLPQEPLLNCKQIVRSLTAMNDPQVQYVSDDQGEVTGVILSIQLWRDILSELETQHLLKSEAMRQRILAAKQRSTGLLFVGKDSGTTVAEEPDF